MILEKKEVTNTIFKAGAWYTISSFMLYGISFITTPIFTRILSLEQFGSYNNFIAWFSILTTISTFNLHGSIIRARFDYKEDFDNYLSSILTFGSILTLICYLVVLSFMDQFTKLFSMEPLYIHITFISIIVSPAINIFQTKERIFYKYKLSVFISSISALGIVVTSLILVNLLHDKLLGRVIGQIAPTFILSIVLYIYIILQGKKINVKYWKYAFIICLPYLPHLLSNNLLGSVDRVMINNLSGPDDAALYSLAYTVGSIAVILLTSMNTAFSPWLGDKLNTKDYRSIQKTTRPYFLIFTLPVLGILLIAPEILYVLGGESYVSAKYVIPPVIVGCIFQFAYTMYVNIEQYEKKTWGVAMGTVTAAVINIVLNIIFLPIYGYMAAAYSTLFGYMCLFLIHFLLVKKMKMDKVYDSKFIFLTLFASLVFMIFSVLIYNSTAIRYLITLIYLTIIVVLFIKNRKAIFNIVSKK